MVHPPFCNLRYTYTDNEVENCMANELGHVTYLDQSWTFKINNGHVTHQGKQN